MAYIIITEENTDLRIEIETLKQQLITKWGSVKFETRIIPNSPSVLVWDVDISGETSWGALHDDQQTIAIDASEEAVAKFAVWYRTIISTKYRLFLYHDQAEFEVEISANTTEKDILNEIS